MVTVYSSPTCAYCHMAMAYLKSKDVKFKEYDVSDNPKAYDWVYKNVGQVVTPVIDIDGTIIVGFDRPQIDDALKKVHHK